MIRFVSFVIVVFALISGASLIFLYPFHPVTLSGWIVWIALTTPLLIVGELLGEKVFSDKIGRLIDNRQILISGKRILYGVVVTLIVVGLVLLVDELANSSISEFIDENFSNDW